MQFNAYTVAVTSCDRFDLLQRTLDSLLPRLDGDIRGIIIIDDSGRLGARDSLIDVVRPYVRNLKDRDFIANGNFLGKGIEIIVNNPPLGHIQSIDRLYAHINTEYIFHCEDDWEFYGCKFIEKSFALLSYFSRYSMVNLQDPNKSRDGRWSPVEMEHLGIFYRVMNENVPARIKGLQFNPGLRRKSDYQIVGPYADFGVNANEARISECYAALGFESVRLCEHATRHIGQDAHVRDLIHYPVKRTEKIKRSALKRFEKLSWKIDSNLNPFVLSQRRFENRQSKSRLIQD